MEVLAAGWELGAISRRLLGAYHFDMVGTDRMSRKHYILVGRACMSSSLTGKYSAARLISGDRLSPGSAYRMLNMAEGLVVAAGG
jgi:hypothetical protein